MLGRVVPYLKFQVSPVCGMHRGQILVDLNRGTILEKVFCARNPIRGLPIFQLRGFGDNVQILSQFKHRIHRCCMQIVEQVLCPVNGRL